MYSLSSDYDVGVVAYNNSLTFSSNIVEFFDRENLIKDVENIKYKGFTNAGVGLEKSVALNVKNDKIDKYIKKKCVINEYDEEVFKNIVKEIYMNEDKTITFRLKNDIYLKNNFRK